MRGSFRRSGEIVREVWGESLGAEAGVVTFLLTLPALVLAGVLYVVLPTSTMVGLHDVLLLGGDTALLAGLIGNALAGIAKMAVYVYATDDEQPPQFAHVDFGRR